MPIDQNGIPEVSTETAASAQELALSVIQPEVPGSNYARLIDNSLAAVPGNAYIVVDTNRRRVMVTDDADRFLELYEAIEATYQAGNAELTPVSGQTGKSLEWEAEFNTFDDHEDAVNSVIEPQKPTRSVSSLVSAVLGGMPDDAMPQLVLVDQTAGKVTFYEMASGANATTKSGQLDGVAVPNNAPSMAFTLAEPETAGEESPTIFEGGATP